VIGLGAEGKNVFLLFGTENYLIKQEEKKITAKLIPLGAEQMNLTVFDGKGVSVEGLINVCETLPFFNECRLVIVRDSGLFAAGRKADSEHIAEYLKEMPASTVLTFIEKEVDKRGKLYKKTTEFGSAREFNAPQERELIGFTVGLLKEQDKDISNATAAYLIRYVSGNMDAIVAEAGKLINYSDKKTVTADDINAVCVKSVEARIFDLVDAVGNKRAADALNLYHNMITLKEPPLTILTMVARQFRLILQCGLLRARNKTLGETARILGQSEFNVRKYAEQGRLFGVKAAEGVLRDCLDTDINIKSGTMGDVLAVEMLIIKYAAVT
jgi:DNA polymerase-3 subunit delta